ncbi:TRAP transporter large permease [Pusillimonas noertemannii]|uniref:TRAP transporter large permease protein n=1 Tax=Pusillimonas noertemannii TaxID=305977 RepID=A0A2U1CSQ0_9BURK|nr:TRAP transporter large permease subunit [Pusillimonas noertemannii]PVY68945.1 tripartite ATP-independent transporter DctM subunit [Pusillimonas noertemannii]
MDWILNLTLLLGAVMMFMLLGLPVALAFLTANIMGAFLFMGGVAGIDQLARNSVASVITFSLTPIPMFVLMGELLFQTGLAIKVIEGFDRMIYRVPARLPVVSIVAGTAFSAVSGSTIATTAMLGRSMTPVMLEKKYHPSLAMGPIIAIGGVDMLIPPSALIVLLGSLANISITKLLFAGILPGLFLATVFVGYIILRAKISPHMVPANDIGTAYSGWPKYRPFFIYVLPLLSIFCVVIGAMTGGLATPTEAAALGVAGTVCLAALYRSLTLKSLLASLRGTVQISGMILFIIVGATAFSQLLGMSGATNALLGKISSLGLSSTELVIAMVLILIVLGCFVDQISMMLLTLPFFMPLVIGASIDQIWFGVLFLIAMQLGLMTPPFGLLLFTMKGVVPPHITITQVFRSATPFVVISLAMLVVVFFLPGIATWLPRALG